MVGLTPTEYFEMYQHDMEPELREQFEKLVDEYAKLKLVHDTAINKIQKIIDDLE